VSNEFRKFFKNAKKGDFRAIGYDSRNVECGADAPRSRTPSLLGEHIRHPDRFWSTGASAPLFRNLERIAQPVKVSLPGMAFAPAGLPRRSRYGEDGSRIVAVSSRLCQ
jgi:hypothetical protein